MFDSSRGKRSEISAETSTAFHVNTNHYTMSPQILPITGLKVGSVSPAVLVCGDPDRAHKIGAELDNVEQLAHKREYLTLQGSYQGMTVTVCSHGVGAGGAAIAFEELIAAGGKTLIRVGTCGGLQPDIETGDLIVASAAVQNTGFGREYLPEGYPAVATPAVTTRLADTAVSHQATVHTGIVITRDTFYGGVDTHNTPDYQVMADANVMAVEMECSALFMVGSLRKAQTGAILAVDGNVLVGPKEGMDTYKPHDTVVADAVSAEIRIALDALVALHQA